MRDLATRYLAEHAAKKSESTQRSAETFFRLFLIPALGSRKVASVTWADLEAIHQRLAHIPYQANGLLILSLQGLVARRALGLVPAGPAQPGPRARSLPRAGPGPGSRPRAACTTRRRPGAGEARSHRGRGVPLLSPDRLPPG